MLGLEIKNQSGERFRQTVQLGRYRLGKSPECEIPLSDTHVSRHHADLLVDADEIYIEDAGSTNGVWRGKRRIEGKDRLYPGDSFSLGTSTVTLLQERPPKVKEGAARGTNDSLNEFKRTVHEKVLEYLDLHKRAVLHTMSAEELRTEAAKAAREVIRAEALVLPTGVPKEELIQAVVAEAIGLGPIEPLLDDESVTEVMVNGADQVYVERNGRVEPVDNQFSSNQSLMSVIERIVTPLGRRVDEGSPMVDARLPDGSRVNAIIPPLSLTGPVMTIRKFSKRRFKIDDLIGMGSMSDEMAQFMEVCVRHRRNVVVSGGTGSGKTTTLNVLSNFIPTNERIVTIEDAAELQLHQDHVVSLESRPANIEGKGQVVIRDLVRNALRMRPDRIVVGECRGGEALDMLQAMNTGHDGSLTTGHANSARDILSRLEVMVLMSGLDLPVRAIREQIASAVDIILHQSRFSDGKRRVTSIVEVDGMEGDVILLQKIFQFNQTGRGNDGEVLGEFTGCGYAPHFYTSLENAGEELPRDIFGGRDRLGEEGMTDGHH